VSELNDPELDELEGRLSRAFAGTRPRRGFEDELWARLERRGSAGRRWPWRRLAPWPAAGALAAVLVIGQSRIQVFLEVSHECPRFRPGNASGQCTAYRETFTNGKG